MSSESVDRIEAFWGGDALDRPLLYLKYRNPDQSDTVSPAPTLKKKALDRDIDQQIEMSRRSILSELCLAEAAPSVTFSHSDNIGLLPLLAGGEYDYDDGGHAWVQEKPGVLEAGVTPYDPKHPDVRAIFNFAVAAADELGDIAFINPVPLGIEALTTLSQFLTAEELCMRLLEDDGVVHSYAHDFDSLSFSFHRDLVKVLNAKGQYASRSWLNIIAPGTMEAVQCDFGSMISPSMYEEYAMPILRRQTEYYDYSLYHLDGTCQMRFLDLLAELPQLNGIQWNPEPGQDIQDWIPAYKKIRDYGLSLHFNSWDLKTVDNAIAVLRALGPNGLSLALPTFAKREEAEAALREIEACC